MLGVCSSLAVGECMAVRKVFTKVSQVSHCPTVPSGIVYFVYVIIYQYIIFFITIFVAYLGQWDSGTLGTLGTLFLSFHSLLPSP